MHNTLLKVVANKDFGCELKWILTHQHYTTCYLMLNQDFQPCSGVASTTRTINSSKIHIPLVQEFGPDGDVDGVDRKASPVQEEATKVGPKILNTSNLYI